MTTNFRDYIGADSYQHYHQFTAANGTVYGFQVKVTADTKGFHFLSAYLLLKYSERDINAGKSNFNTVIERDNEGNLYQRLPLTESLLTLSNTQNAINEAVMEVLRRNDRTPEEKSNQEKQRKTAALLNAMARTGKAGKELAEAFSKSDNDPWREADSDTASTAPPDAVGLPLIIVGYIDALWTDTKPLEQKRMQVATSYVVARALNTLQTRGAVALTDDKTHLIEIGGTGQAIARVSTTDAAVLKRLSSGADELSTMNGHYIIRCIRSAGHDQYTMMPDNPQAARILNIERGWEGLYQMATGCSPSVAQKNAPVARDLIYLLHSTTFDIPNVAHGGLLNYLYYEPAPGRPSHLTIEIGEMLMPGFVDKLPKGSKARLLVPMPERLPLSLNSVAGQMKAPCLCLLNGIFLFATERSIDLSKNGSFEMNRHDWERLTDTAQVVKKTKQAIEKGWIVSNPQQLSFDSVLIQVDVDRYQFSSHYRNESDFIIGGGNKRVRGRSAGKAAAALRLKKDNKKTR